MTQDEFLENYHNYYTTDKEAAQREADKVNRLGVVGDRAVVANLGPVGYCLMLESAARHRVGGLMDTEEKKLMDCPFCGSDDIDGTGRWVVCNRCRGYGPTGTDTEDAISLWNNRPQVERLESAVASMSQNMTLQSLTIHDLRSSLSRHAEMYIQAFNERQEARKWAKRYKRACQDLMDISQSLMDDNLALLWKLLMGSIQGGATE